jgi:hypothetical protein
MIEGPTWNDATGSAGLATRTIITAIRLMVYWQRSRRIVWTGIIQRSAYIGIFTNKNGIEMADI